MNEELDISSITSMWIARLAKHVKITAHLLEFACPPLVFLAKTSQGPKTSSPTWENGGEGLTLLLGGSLP